MKYVSTVRNMIRLLCKSMETKMYFYLIIILRYILHQNSIPEADILTTKKNYIEKNHIIVQYACEDSIEKVLSIT